MKGLGKAEHCDGCEAPLLDYHGRQSPGDVLCHSIVYGTRDVVLCKNCSEFEMEEEAKHGTNDLPHLLKQYRANVGRRITETD